MAQQLLPFQGTEFGSLISLFMLDCNFSLRGSEALS